MNEYFTKSSNMKTNAIQPQSMFSITVTKLISIFKSKYTHIRKLQFRVC